MSATPDFQGLPFIKMHGLGNDFVIADLRAYRRPLPPKVVRRIADRRLGVGCDQFITVEPPQSRTAAATMGIHNADGGEVEACGNAARCVAWLLMDELGEDRVEIDTKAGPIHAWAGAEDGLVTVDMGPARLDWREIPLAAEHDTLSLPVEDGDLTAPVGVSVGNPHAVFFVDDAEAVALSEAGPRLEHHPLFPDRVNVEVATVTAPDTLRMRVWERGVGITKACGTGACAAAVAAVRRGLTGRTVTVVLDGGPLTIDWREDGHVWMTGPVSMPFHGVISEGLLAT